MSNEDIIAKIDLIHQKIKQYIKKRDELTGKLEALKKREEEIFLELKEKYGIESIEELNEEINKLEREIKEKITKLEYSIKEIENELNRKYRE
ncbi:MAG: hypothetical protein QMD25_00770 [Caldisericia bacterium]|jgi:seryl-tRNA synthetase|nr:hypothetical protein [Caldisericia bacterium]